MGCEQVAMKTDKIETKIEKKYSNSGFALIFDENVKKIKKLDDRSLMIHHKSLKRKSAVKITNPKNGKSLIAEVKSNNQKFSDFYNSDWLHREACTNFGTKKKFGIQFGIQRRSKDTRTLVCLYYDYDYGFHFVICLYYDYEKPFRN